MASRALRPQDPRRLGDYQLLARLGEGGMGTVFLARDPSGRHVAVKAIRPEYAGHEEFRARFRSEVNRVRQVPSFCTAAVLDADPDSRTPYLVVEYVDGPSLHEVVAEGGPMSAGDLHSVAVGVAAALTAIHGAGVIHRDLKPTNVLLSLGLPKVIDFGIARALEPTSQHTRTDHVVGTVAYMAPERLDSALGATTPAADIFAWGAVVAYAGTGRTPFGGDTPMATAARILTMPPDLSGLPETLSRLVAQALAKNPDERPTATDLLQQLLAVTARASASVPATPNAPARFNSRDLFEQLMAEGPRRTGDSPATARPQSTPPGPYGKGAGPYGKRRSHRLIYAFVAVLVLAIAGGFVAYAWTGADAQEAAPQTVTSTQALPPSARGPSFFDPLSTAGRFQAGSSDAGSCAFTGGKLHAKAKAGSTYQCPGPSDAFGGDQSISVDLTLATAGSCGMLWFRAEGVKSYQLTVCADQVQLERAGDAVLTNIGLVQSATLDPGTSHKLSVVVASEHAMISIDGALTLQASVDDPELESGRTLLGVTSGTGAAEVSFANLEVDAS